MVDALSSQSGGARTYMRAVLPRLAQRGARLTVVCRESQRRDFGLTAPQDGITVEVAPERVAPLSARLAYSSTVVPLLCARRHVDVLFCPTDHAPPWAPCAVTMMIRNPTPYVRGESTVASTGRRIREAGMRTVTEASAWRSDRIILVSQAALDATAAVIRLPTSRLRVIHHGRDARFHPPTPGHVRDEALILAVSSIYAFKNYPVLLEALALLHNVDGLHPRVLIAGAPFDREHAAFLHRHTEALGISKQVSFLGEVPHADLIDLYRRATVFVMPSRLETFGHPYIEAMATGTATVAADIPCAREMCGDAVQYFPPSSPAGLAEQLRQLLRDLHARAELEQRGPRQAERFSWDRCADETLAVFHEAANAHVTPGRALKAV
ncbi:MAG: glycosyltransferase family 1 protein [Myxococcota bacterium]